jgi:biotin transport system substrate-specific component
MSHPLSHDAALSPSSSRPASLIGRLPAAGSRDGFLARLALCAAGSGLIAISAQLAVPVPFSPVPVTGQTFAVLVVAALLGARLGGATLVLYLAEGAAGLPVFAHGGAGVAHLFGPSGGYLVGFVPAAVVVGALAQRGWDRTLPRTLAAMTIGTAVIFACGLLWLGRFVPGEGLLAAGLVPFLPGAGIKIGLAAVLLPVGWRVLGTRG